jgi:hypothetical protein
VRERIRLENGDATGAAGPLTELLATDRHDPATRLLHARCRLALGKPAEIGGLLGRAAFNQPSIARDAAKLLRDAGAAQDADALERREGIARQVYRALRTRAIKADWIDVGATVGAIRAEGRAALKAGLP